MPFSAMILRAAGMAVGAAVAGAAAGAVAALVVAGAAALALASVSIWAMTSPEATDSPFCLTILTITPASGAGSSSTTLSVSMSIRFWSRATASPSLTCQADSVASATDSDSWGTLTSMIMVSPLFLDAEGSVHDFLLLLGVFRGIADGRGRR
jgi:hypothetical protein